MDLQESLVIKDSRTRFIIIISFLPFITPFSSAGSESGPPGAFPVAPRDLEETDGPDLRALQFSALQRGCRAPSTPDLRQACVIHPKSRSSAGRAKGREFCSCYRLLFTGIFLLAAPAPAPQLPLPAVHWSIFKGTTSGWHPGGSEGSEKLFINPHL